MASPYLNDFRSRVARVERAHRRGRGFEAPGTLGRPRYVVQRRRSWLRPVLLIVCAILLFKAALFLQIGPVDYNERVARLRAGSQVEQIGAYALQADGITVWLANFMGDLFKAPI